MANGNTTKRSISGRPSTTTRRDASPTLPTRCNSFSWTRHELNHKFQPKRRLPREGRASTPTSFHGQGAANTKGEAKMDLNRRAFICIAAATLVPPDLAVAQVQRETPVDTDLVEGVLNAGKWSATADDNGGGEQLPEEFVKSIVQMYEAQKSQPSQKAVDGVGIMVLALSVAEWGVTWTRKPPADPANTEWRGPTDITQGKHLMSYALGGIGIPHLDVDGAQRFLSEVGTRYPKAATDVAPFTNRRQTFRYDRVRATGGPCAPHTGDTVIMTDLDGKPFEHNAMTFEAQNTAQDSIQAVGWMQSNGKFFGTGAGWGFATKRCRAGSFRIGSTMFGCPRIAGS